MRTRYRPALQTTTARECLFALGPTRAIDDRKAGEIRIETGEDHPSGFRIPICCLPRGRMAEARAIIALFDLIRASRPFAALGRSVAGHEPTDPLLRSAALAISAGDAQAVAAALDRALGPADHFRSAGRGHGPQPVHKP